MCMPGRESRIWEWGWLTSREAVNKHQCVHLSCSWEDVHTPSQPTLPPPSPPSCFASSHPRKRTAFWICQSVLSEGDQGEKSGQPHLSQFTCEQCSGTSVQPVRAKSKILSWRRSKMMTAQCWNSWNVYEMEGALMGWPQTCYCVLCWNYYRIKCSIGDLSRHMALMSEYTGKRSMLIITWAQNGWMRSFTKGGDDPLINLSN